MTNRKLTVFSYELRILKYKIKCNFQQKEVTGKSGSLSFNATTVMPIAKWLCSGS